MIDIKITADEYLRLHKIACEWFSSKGLFDPHELAHIAIEYHLQGRPNFKWCLVDAARYVHGRDFKKHISWGFLHNTFDEKGRIPNHDAALDVEALLNVKLTKRESAIIKMVLEDYTLREAANDLGMSYAGAYAHKRKAIFKIRKKYNINPSEG